jgi:hypothetical protein
MFAILRITLALVLVSVAFSAAAQSLSSEVRGREGTLGLRWGASTQELEREGAKHDPHSRYAGSDLGEYYEIPTTPNAAARLLGEKLARGRYAALVDAREGVRIAMLLVDEDFASAAALWARYDSLKSRLVEVLGPPTDTTEQNGTGTWTDRTFFDCLGHTGGRNWLTSPDCRLEAAWSTDTGRLVILVWGEDGEGHIALAEFPRRVQD